MPESPIGSLSAATVRILSADGAHAGQGVGIALEEGRQIILTCQHVLARNPDPERIPVDLFGPADELLGRVIARQDAQRSRTEQDLAVLVPAEPVAFPPVPLARLGAGFEGPQQVSGIIRIPDDVQRYNATLAAPTPLVLKDSLFTGKIPVAFRLICASDVRPGISGSPVMCAGALLGLTHFSRSEGSSTAREGYMVPISAWFPMNRELEAMSRPFVDATLAARATVKIGADLNPATDFDLEYDPDRVLERPEEEAAEELLGSLRRCLILGRPGSGKTWIAYRLMRKRPGVVVIPRLGAPPERFDKSALFENGLLLAIDGAENLEGDFNFKSWYSALEHQGISPGLLVTSRDGADWVNLKRRFHALAMPFEGRGGKRCVFTSATSEGGTDISPREAKGFVERAGLGSGAFGKFDGTIGSLIGRPQAMRERYTELVENHLGSATGTILLDSLKILRLLHLPLEEKRARRIAGQMLNDPPPDAVWRWLRHTTEQSGFGRFDESGFFRGYKIYLDHCVTYVPTMDDFYRFVDTLKEETDEFPLVRAGIKLLQHGDARGIDFLGIAISKGSKDAILAALAEMGDIREALPGAIHIAHEMVRRGHREFLGTLARLYRRRGKTSLAIRAYRAAVAAGDEGAKQPLGCLLLEDASTAAEGRAYLRAELQREDLRPDPTGMAAVALGAHLINEIGSEREAEALLRGVDPEGNPMAQLFLGALYCAWPGHFKQAKAVLKPLTKDTASGFSRFTANLASILIRQIATMQGDEAEMKRWANVSLEKLAASGAGVSPILQIVENPTFSSAEGNPASSSRPRANSISISESSFRFELPQPRRFEILQDGWRRVWTPNEQELSAILEEYAGYERAGYAQAGLVTAAAHYRNGRSEEALAALRAALAEWPDQDRLEQTGRLLEVCIATECGRFQELSPMLDSFAQTVRDTSPPPGLPELAAHVAAVLRNVDPGATGHERYSANVHDCLSVLWAVLPQMGPAWFERRKWLAFAGKSIGGSLSERLELTDEEKERTSPERRAAALAEAEALLEKLRADGAAILRIANYRGLELLLRTDDGIVQVSGTWPALWRDHADQTFYKTALFLSKRFLEVRWGPDVHSFDILLREPMERLDAERMEKFVGLIVDILVEARKTLVSGTLGVGFETSDSGIALSFSRLAPAEALQHWQQQVQETGENPLVAAEAHCRVGDHYFELREGNRGENIATAIDAYEKSLALLKKSEHKWYWANVQEKLGIAHLERATFSREAAVRAAHCLDQARTVWKRSADAHRWAVLMVNRGRATRMAPGKARGKTAVEFCEAGLAVFERNTTPDMWAWTREELGLCYLSQVQEQVSNRRPMASQIAAARACFEAALQVRFRETNPYRWAALHSSLADCELADQSGNRREAIARAIGALRRSLEVFEERPYPIDWGIVQGKLAGAYLAESAWQPESLAESIACAEAALRVTTRESWPEKWVNLQFSLGCAYRRLPAVNSPQTLELAIQCFQETLSARVAAVSPPLFRLAVWKTLGETHLAMGAHESGSYAKAIDCFQKALNICDAQKFPGDWADLHASIARAHLESGARPRETGLRKAHHHASLCLKVAKPETMPYAWALDLELLGRIDLALASFTPEVLSAAREQIENALKVFTRGEYEVRWAANQDFLGRYYAALQTGNRPENLEKSIECIRNSLEVFTTDRYPRDRIVLLEQLVYALVEISTERGQTFVEEAIRVAREGVELSSGQKRSSMWGQMQDALGFAYSKLLAPDPGVNIAKAIAVQTAALQSYPKEGFPVDYALVQMHLGFSYVAQAGVVESDDLWDLALNYFQDAATVLSREEAPRLWGFIQNGMACAWRRRGDTLDRAADLHRSALEVFTPQRFPQDHAEVNIDFAETYLHFGAAGSSETEEACQCLKVALSFFHPVIFPNRHRQIEAKMRAAGMISGRSGAS